MSEKRYELNYGEVGRRVLSWAEIFQGLEEGLIPMGEAVHDLETGKQFPACVFQVPPPVPADMETKWIPPSDMRDMMQTIMVPKEARLPVHAQKIYA